MHRNTWARPNRAVAAGANASKSKDAPKEVESRKEDGEEGEEVEADDEEKEEERLVLSWPSSGRFAYQAASGSKRLGRT